ncbi:restriction endonuclease subunit S [Flammeovirga sp. MY04]|uniref:restriction endonuclease subunit S n=1 Tax=Flammeovirga sp. MY04 TaxID=1191459 RepID=UPI0008060E1B|nr:restriction endonuclease subunit S [Flammeovirga sp. MY04]ANQ51491.1 restriction endonuclease subunit S [Flammeovirga sp. MY04]
MGVQFEKYPKYKDSGVEWLGEVPENWNVIRLKNIVSIKKNIIGFEGPDVLSITQRGIKKKNITSGEGQLAVNYSNYQIVDKGDFAMNHMDLLTGYVDISRYDGVISPDYRVFQVSRNEIDKNFLLRVFQYCYQQKVFFGFGQGVSMLGRWRLPADNFLNFRIALPSIDTQTRIATYLDTQCQKIDTAIAKKERLIELLKERKQIIIQNAVTKGLDPNVKMKDSGVEWIGEIPECWGVKKLKYILKNKLKYGANESGVEYSPDLPRYIRITDFGFDGKLSSDKKLSLTWKQGGDYLLEDGDILFARSGATVGKTYQFRKSMSNEKNYCFAGYLIKASPDENIILSDFLNYFTSSNSFESWKESIFNKATIENIGADKYSTLEIPIPNIQEQKSINLKLDEVSRSINHIINKQLSQITKLKEYKSVLINNVVTGKVKV